MLLDGQFLISTDAWSSVMMRRPSSVGRRTARHQLKPPPNTWRKGADNKIVRHRIPERPASFKVMQTAVAVLVRQGRPAYVSISQHVTRGREARGEAGDCWGGSRLAGDRGQPGSAILPMRTRASWAALRRLGCAVSRSLTASHQNHPVHGFGTAFRDGVGYKYRRCATYQRLPPLGWPTARASGYEELSHNGWDVCRTHQSNAAASYGRHRWQVRT